ncbi:MAG: right-handed parallel beta-helix repeat-containing protein [Pirellulales bacterium]
MRLACAAEYYVSVDGDDKNSGAIGQPLGTLKAAASKLRPGDTCCVRGGTYFQPLEIDGLRGTAKSLIVFRAYKDETVVLDGTVRINAQWTPWKDSIFQASIREDIWQLFDGRKPLDLARWPNASVNDGTVWDTKVSTRSTDRNWNNKLGRSDSITQQGVIFDQNHPGTQLGINSETLAETGIDFTGAVAVLNIGHWRTWARPILSHKGESNRFTYDPSQTSMLKFLEYYIFGLPALDLENEWWFNSATKTIYFKPESGADPARLLLNGKVRDYNFRATDCAHIHFIGIDFFSTSFGLTDCSNMLIEDCQLLYPSTHKFVLGEFEWFGTKPPAATDNAMTFIYNSGDGAFSNVIRNCSIEYANSPAIGIFNPGSMLENCYIHDVEWDMNSSGGSGSIPGGPETTVRNCTIHTTGGSEGIRLGSRSTIEGNRLYNTSLLQHDGSAINIGTPSQPGTMVRQNWIYDTNRQAMRLDSTASRFGTNASVFRNVFFNVDGGQGGNKFKGDYHLFANNTAFDCFVAIPKGFGSTDVHNRHSLVRNNLVDLLVEWNLTNRIEGITARMDNNVHGQSSARRLLRDPDNFDFRPHDDASELIDSGAPIRRSELPGEKIRLPKQAFVGISPDIGAYEYGDATYWIPGCRLPKASFPVPPNRSQTVKVDADLMWLQGRDAASHDVLVARTREEVELAGSDSSHLIASEIGIKNNLFDPGKLEHGQTYYWRVDVIKQNGKRINGDIWAFRVKP